MGVPPATLAAAAQSPIAAGVFIGLVLGKVLGLTFAAFVAMHLPLAEMPADLFGPHIVGASLLGVVSDSPWRYFIAQLSFDQPGALASAKIGIFGGSLMAGVAGYLPADLAPREAMAAPVSRGLPRGNTKHNDIREQRRARNSSPGRSVGPRAGPRDSIGTYLPAARAQPIGLRAMAARSRNRSYLVMARVRRALRALNSSFERGAASVGITMQEQAFLLALAAYGGGNVALADVREELEMDQASASVLLGRLVRERLVIRVRASDRRAAEISLTPRGWSVFKRSLSAIRLELHRAQHRGELAAIGTDLSAYFAFYFGRRTRQRQLTLPE